MFYSLRTKLTFWYSGVLAIVLVVFSVLTYSFIAYTQEQLTDDALLEMATAFLNSFVSEIQQGNDSQETNEVKSIKDIANETINDFKFKDYYFFVYDNNKQIITYSEPILVNSTTDTLFPFLLSELPNLIDKSESKQSHFYKTFIINQYQVRLFLITSQVEKQPYTIVVTCFLNDQKKFLSKLKYIFFITIPFILVLASIGGWLLARKSLSPIVVMSQQAMQIGADNLYERLPVINNQDELGRLATIFNDLLERLNQSFEMQRRFIADASHELRTPIAIVQGEAEVTLSDPNCSVERSKESLSIIQDEAKRLSKIVEDMLTLARADSGQYQIRFVSFYLDELVADCVRTIRSLSSKKDIKIICEIREEMLFQGDEVLIRRMILNLLDNARKYTMPGGIIQILCEKQKDTYVIAITDNGPGIPQDAQAHIFERFFRADKSRSRIDSNGGGTGLGLSIALWIAQTHKGTIKLSHSDSFGSTFTITLPIQNSL